MWVRDLTTGGGGGASAVYWNRSTGDSGCWRRRSSEQRGNSLVVQVAGGSVAENGMDLLYHQAVPFILTVLQQLVAGEEELCGGGIPSGDASIKVFRVFATVLMVPPLKVVEQPAMHLRVILPVPIFGRHSVLVGRASWSR